MGRTATPPSRRRRSALDAFYIDGIRHNIPFLAALMQHPRWRAGKLSTAFIAEEFPDGFAAVAPDEATAQHHRSGRGRDRSRSRRTQAPHFRADGRTARGARTAPLGLARRHRDAPRRGARTARHRGALYRRGRGGARHAARLRLEAGRSGVARDDRRRAGRRAGATDSQRLPAVPPRRRGESLRLHRKRSRRRRG